ncbi:MAG TPA: glycoside hydrolase family 38 C-terminal domain-containing protein [Candidatus Elarobacter sp.]
MRVRLERRGEDDALVTLGAQVTFPDGPLRLRYPTRTGATLRIDGVVRGAFDGPHETIALRPAPGLHDVVLEVERRAMPVSGLPSGDGLRWRLMLRNASQRPHDELLVEGADAAIDERAIDVPLIGHAHLDIAWLWTYDEAKRKAVRTFATALREMELDPAFVFAQSQPQLYAWAFALAPELAERVRAHLGRGWDASVAPMWVEPDLHAPSGESVLRQFAYGTAWTRDELGVTPSVVWLPDTFGFPSTFAQLAAHAGMPYFATTKLQWNDTTRWPYPRFRWEGDDGSAILAAVLDSYDGDLDEKRLRRARERGEPLVVGYGDGGGGATDEQLARVGPGSRGWTAVDAWFAGIAQDALPAYCGELYLETHRGTYTTHHDVKSRNAALERELAAAEELAAWCVAVRAPLTVRRALVDDLRTAWRIVLRGQFHDVISGSSIGAVYDDVRAEHDRAAAVVARLAASAASILPRADLQLADAPVVAPLRESDRWVFRNEYLTARVGDDGTIDEPATAGDDGPRLSAMLNGLVAFVDKPKAWDAWNLDRGYERHRVPVKCQGSELVEGALAVRFTIGKRSRATMRVELREAEPFLRVDLAVAWAEDHVILRAEHRMAIETTTARFGQPHGTLVRDLAARDVAAQARFEVPAQRWVHAEGPQGGVAIFTPDLYGWNGVALPKGGLRIGTSLLRAPRWPDPGADRGEQRLQWAFAPTSGATISGLEHAWLAYTEPDRVRLFTCDDPSVLVVASYPSADADGVIVRVRECDGAPRTVALRCGGRMRTAIAVDAVERPTDEAVRIVEEELVFDIRAFALRSFLVRF